MAIERRSIWRVGPESKWRTVLPVTFIIISLLSLLVLPIVVATRTARMRQEITIAAEPARGAEQLDIIGLSAQRMRRLIEDLLDVTRLEGGKRLPIEPAAVEVEPLLRETHELFKAQAVTSGISLQYEVADKLPPVFADRHRVLQVLWNLIGNAMKFTPSGGTICFGAEAREPGKGTRFYITLPWPSRTRASARHSRRNLQHIADAQLSEQPD